ncbi:hypothetical protein ACHAW5_006630 [Stephanodiscus triporus]|uniref:SEP domain-containing protein n=1 Tax=Stephanodiscus triporus TaxID=2934178 RepID=A0ABD3MP61_9STRA
MYRSGFTVDDGPHRRLDDPPNAEFLDEPRSRSGSRELSSLSSSSSSREGGLATGGVGRHGYRPIATPDEPYVITVCGYPPRALDDLNITVEGAGLVGSQVVLKRA